MIQLTAHTLSMLADTQTPVGIYLKVRDIYPESALMESSDYNSTENSFSFIGIQPIGRFVLCNGEVTEIYPDGANQKYATTDICNEFNGFLTNFQVKGQIGRVNGLMGYTSYDTVHNFDNIEVTRPANALPEMVYILYKYIIAINHLTGEMSLTELLMPGQSPSIEELLTVVESRNFPSYDFRTTSDVSSTIDDDTYMEMVRRGVSHCLRGDVFQIVLSRRFSQSFAGDDFMVYRALRSVNPSPYLFYFDFGSFRIFGSSPETHLKIEGSTATIDPIAGTFRRTGDDGHDEQLARELLLDEKENAEHVMLVDLARNDLSRNADKVRVVRYKDIHFYSHVIHMVSRVCGRLHDGVNRVKLYADTFPAGTLSGAPKVRAMQLISSIEPHARGLYGGSIGYVGFDGNLNQAITIRTFLSRGNNLEFQAGAGITARSEATKELAEVNNKLGALRRAIEIAQNIRK